MEQPKKQEEPPIPFDEWIAGIAKIHGAGSFVLLKIEDDGSISLVGAASGIDSLKFILETQQNVNYFG